jgi:hypothetical protein
VGGYHGRESHVMTAIKLGVLTPPCFRAQVRYA